MNSDDGFAIRFLQARNRRGVSAVKLAHRLKTVPSVLWQWESGKHMPNSRMLFKICKELNCSADWLLGLTDNREIMHSAL